MAMTFLKQFNKVLLSASVIGGAAFAETSSRNREPMSVKMDAITQTPEDMKTTKQVKEHIAADTKLSANAKKIEIDTINQTVTLIGTVNNKKELEIIKEHVRMVQPKAIINAKQLKVASK